MRTSTTSQTTDSLLNRGLENLSLHEINRYLTLLFQKYMMTASKMDGSDLIGKFQTRQLQREDDLAMEYAKGQIVVKNSIDNLQFLLANRKTVGKVIGVDSEDIYRNRRNLGAITEYLQKLRKYYDIGDQDSPMQIYMSRMDGNVEGLEVQTNWADYILTQDWIDRLADASIRKTPLTDQQLATSDSRIEYLADLIHGMVKDHEIGLHKTLAEFDSETFMDRAHYKTLPSGEDNPLEPVDTESKYQHALNQLNSIGNLDYGFYEIFKPIGGTSEKYIKVKLSASGEMDVTGVVGLSDCEHVEWEYGSMEYLRSLNTGNQKYLFKMSRPFNDTDSVMWWKPDKAEPLEPDYDEEEEGEVTQTNGNRYYRPYETERFLRWFGTNYIPVMDPNSIMKKTICSIPMISNDVESSGFYSDATNIMERNTDMTRVNIDSSTSISLLSMSPKSTLDIVPVIDSQNPERSGQYLQFIVSGHQQTSNLAFHVTGKMYNSIQSMNHFGNTWKILTESYRCIGKFILFLELSNVLNRDLEELWNQMNPEESLIPEIWRTVYSQLEPFQRPNAIDLLRFRQIDIESVMNEIYQTFTNRLEFMDTVSGIDTKNQNTPIMISKLNYIRQNKNLNQETAKSIIDKLDGRTLLDQNLKRYIFNFPDSDNETYKSIPLGDSTKKRLLEIPLRKMHNMVLDDEDTQAKEQLDSEMAKYEMAYDVSVDELRDSITTFNNLIVRLPTDTYHNKVASRHIFLDWKNFVDKSLKTLLEGENLFKKIGVTTRGIGTDRDEFGFQKVHEYTEYYVDRLFTEPLIDYSYLYDVEDTDGPMNPYTDPETGKPIGDRWDYWSETDFLDPLPQFSYESLDVLKH